MYKDFYHMKSEPFGTLPSPDIYFASETHQGAWDYLARRACESIAVTFTGDRFAWNRKISSLPEACYGADTTKLLFRFVYSPVPIFDYRFILKDLALRLDIPVTGDDEAAIQYGIYNYFRESAR